MIPIGYMLKSVASPPSRLAVPGVDHLHSVSGCISAGFMDYIPLWRHNGWWRFDSAAELRRIAAEHALDPDDFTLFYYEVFEQEYDEANDIWHLISPEPSFTTAVEPPAAKRLSGYDVVTFFGHNAPECSPLSCNSLAQTLPVNRFCLFDAFQPAYDAVASGKFTNSEPGPYRIIAVYTVDADGWVGPAAANPTQQR